MWVCARSLYFWLVSGSHTNISTYLHKPLCGRLCSYPEVSADEDVDAGDDEEGEDELEHWGKYRVPKLHNNT